MEICELAATGMNQNLLMSTVAVLVGFMALLVYRHKYKNRRVSLVAAVVLFVALFIAPLQQPLVAQSSAYDCPPVMSEPASGNGATNEEPAPPEPEVPTDFVVMATDVTIYLGMNCNVGAVVSLADSDVVTTTEGTIDWATVDLDPSTLGLQQSINTGDYTATVDATGLVHVDNFVHGSEINIPYTVMNNFGSVSNVALIIVTEGPPCIYG